MKNLVRASIFTLALFGAGAAAAADAKLQIAVPGENFGVPVTGPKQVILPDGTEMVVGVKARLIAVRVEKGQPTKVVKGPACNGTGRLSPQACGFAGVVTSLGLKWGTDGRRLKGSAMRPVPLAALPSLDKRTLKKTLGGEMSTVKNGFLMFLMPLSKAGGTTQGIIMIGEGSWG